MIRTELTTTIYVDNIASGKLTGEWIHDVQVSKNYRRQGYGTKLLKELIAHGGTKLFVKKTNKKAIALYTKLGFVKFANDQRKGYIDMKLQQEIQTNQTAPETEKSHVCKCGTQELKERINTLEQRVSNLESLIIKLVKDNENA